MHRDCVLRAPEVWWRSDSLRESSRALRAESKHLRRRLGEFVMVLGAGRS